MYYIVFMILNLIGGKTMEHIVEYINTFLQHLDFESALNTLEFVGVDREIAETYIQNYIEG